MPNNSIKRCLATCLAVALGLPVAPAWAAVPDDLRDLVGAKGRDGEPALEQRGYTHIDTAKSAQSAYSYWWSNSKQACVRVTTRDGRYEDIRDVDAGDCSQTKKESKSNVGTVAAVAVGAAALLGVLALAHKSHHRDDKNYDERQTADFERGYRDGLYHNSYHNYDNTREYSDGYSKGVEERSRESSYRGSNYGYDRGGYQSNSRVSDLSGRNIDEVWREMGRRGYQQAAEKGGSPDSGTTYFWNDRTAQCVSVYVRRGRAEGVTEVGRYACNR